MPETLDLAPEARSLSRLAHIAERFLNLVFGVFILDNAFFLRLASLSLLGTLVIQSHAGAQERLVKIFYKRDGASTAFYVQNLQSAEITVTLEFNLKNLSCPVDLPYTATFPPNSTTKALSLEPTDDTRSSHWEYEYFATWGSLHARHDDRAVYLLPYALGDGFPVSQGYGGHYSHTGGDKYSVDFRMPVGTPIHAARGGKVVGVKSDSDQGGGDKKYEWDANYVLIEHSDKTLGHYVHLKKNGSTVKVGQDVVAGQLIGYSGNTGHSTGPHLHFAVFAARDGKQRQTIPVRYFTNESPNIVLTEGRTYRAVGSPSIMKPQVHLTEARGASAPANSAAPQPAAR